MAVAGRLEELAVDFHVPQSLGEKEFPKANAEIPMEAVICFMSGS